MSVTLVGWPVMITGLLTFSNPRFLYYLFIFFIPFSASAVVNVSSITYGLQIPYFFAILWMLSRSLPFVLGQPLVINKKSLLILLPVILFVMVAFISLLMPMVLPNGILVHAPEDWSYNLSPLGLNRTHFTQFAYLLFVILVAIFTTMEIKDKVTLKQSIKIFVAGAVFSCLWGIFQLATYNLGVSYPAFLFNNSIGLPQVVGFSKRLSSVATEPSIFAYYLASVFPLVLVSFLKKNSIFNRGLDFALLMLLLVVMLLTISTTAFLVLGTTLILTVLYSFRSMSAKSLFKLFAGSILVLGLAFLLLKMGLLDLEILKSNTINKLQTGSGQERYFGFSQSIKLFWKEPVLGVGWGSNRSFDLLSTILSSIGILGLLSFLTIILGVFKIYQSLRKRTDDRYVLASSLGVLASLLMTLLANAFSVPTIIFLNLWFLVGIMAAMPQIPQKGAIQ